MTPAARRFHWDTQEYSDAFAALLRCSRGREGLHRRLQEICSAYPADSHAVDWGAGGGDLTRLLLSHHRRVFAVEPNPAMRTELAARCPEARILDGSLLTAVPPAPAAVGLISHVLYHIPDERWAACARRAAGHLTPDGVLVTALKAPDSGCNGMLEHFGAPRFDLPARLGAAYALPENLSVSFERIPATFVTESFEETLTIARFMLCDRDAAAFPREPKEDELREYVRRHFWNESAGTGGWRYDELLCLVRKRPGGSA